MTPDTSLERTREDRDADMLFHIAIAAEWIPGCGAYTPDRYVDDGFIHCSTSTQVLRVANERFSGRMDLLLLSIDATLVDAPIRYENLEGGLEMFPHIYGPLKASAITSVVPFIPRSDGQFELPGSALVTSRL